MTENEKLNLYKTLESNRVSVRNEDHKMFYAQHYYTDTVYSFGTYKVVETIHAKDSKLPGLYFITVFNGNRPLGGWCQNNPQESRYIYDIYMAVKDRATKAKNMEKQYQ